VATVADERIRATVAGLTRRSRWALVDRVPLRFDAGHPQGMVRLDDHWVVTTVDVDARRGWVLVVDRAGHLVARIAVGDAVRFHPGGTGHDGTALWVAAAEYRPSSTTVVQRVEVAAGRVDDAFAVDDHAGAIVRAGPDGDLVGWTWESRRFLRWRVDGTPVAERANPGHFVDHQDGQWLTTGHVLCGGVAGVALADGAAALGGLALLRVADLVVEHEVPFPGYSPTGRVGTHNPLVAEVVGDELHLHVLPDDGTGAVLTFATPAPAWR